MYFTFCFCIGTLLFSCYALAGDSETHWKESEATCGKNAELALSYAAMEENEMARLPDLPQMVWDNDEDLPEGWWGEHERHTTGMIARLLHSEIVYSEEHMLAQSSELQITNTRETNGRWKRSVAADQTSSVVRDGIELTEERGSCKSKSTTSSKDGSTFRICGECSVRTKLGGGWHPSVLNELICETKNCLSDEGVCRQLTINIVLRRRVNGRKQQREFPLRYGCVPHLRKGSVLKILL